MLDPKKIERFARYIHESIPKIIHDLKSDLDIKIRKILKKQINCMNLINRDEFDIQTQILCETQEQLKQLETRLELLESTHTEHYPPNNDHHG